MNDILTQLINQFMPFAQERIGFNEPPKLFLKQDEENASNPLGKTAFYNPSEKSITLYITGRHPKDILRSLGHELVHHKQNCDGKFEDSGDMGKGYAQKNPHLRQMETEANGIGSMCLRDFEDGLREQKTIYYEHLQKGEIAMSMKDWKNKELTTLLSEAWGFKFNTLQEFDEFNGTGELQEEGAEEIEELANARRPPGRPRPQGTGGRVDPDAPFKKPPTNKAEVEDEEEGQLEESEDGGDCGEKGKTWKKGKKSKTDPGTKDDGSRTGDKGDTGKGKDYTEKDELREVIKTLLGKYIKG
jgi:hypothetical protein